MTYETVGFLEFNSIARGIEAADAVIKAADVDLIFARAGCPGKYYILFTGEVAAVKASLDAGAALGENYVVDSCIIPRVHPQVIKAVNLATEPGPVNAVGIMEFFSVAASIYAADAAVKAADVVLIDVRLGTGIGGKSFVVLTGEVAAVNEAVRCGTATKNAEGMVVSSVVIPNPAREVFEALI
jgi:microcompartment protein CcmL/EutN